VDRRLGWLERIGAGGPERLLAYRSAADLCAANGDDMGVLFVAREARSAGFGGAVATHEAAARRALGLDMPATDAVPGLEDRLQTAELWLAHDLVESALPEFEALYRDRGILGLTPECSARVVLGFARCLRARGQMDAAVELVRRERSADATIDFRRSLDAGMAAFFEEAGLFEHAADAWGGSY
jgi:hypothetical protein